MGKRKTYQHVPKKNAKSPACIDDTQAGRSVLLRDTNEQLSLIPHLLFLLF